MAGRAVVAAHAHSRGSQSGVRVSVTLGCSDVFRSDANTCSNISSNGIAARYPGDKNIASDPAVIFADDFEAYTSATQLRPKWTHAPGHAKGRLRHQHRIRHLLRGRKSGMNSPCHHHDGIACSVWSNP